MSKLISAKNKKKIEEEAHVFFQLRKFEKKIIDDWSPYLNFVPKI
jgi:hypothetical protein